jgi:UDP-N-acetylglucosamine:LPS N-acetylglucosamine transferase
MSKNVCLYFSDTGGGHRSAADAIDAAIQRLVNGSGNRPDIKVIKDSIAEKCHPLNRFFSETYNYLLRHHQPLMKYYYWFLHAAHAESGINIPLTEQFFGELLTEHKPAVVVSVHPMQQHMLAHNIKRLKLKTKLVVVVTDPGAELWRAWACEDTYLTIVPNNVVKNRLIEFGLAPEHILVMGMPVHPDFTDPPTMSRGKFLSHLGLSEDLLTVCINAGWAGGGNMLKIYRHLSQVKRPLQVLFLCGHNQELYDEALAAAGESNIPTAVLPFHDCMSDLMASVDLMVSKAGGLTTYQAIARRLPLVYDVTTEPMPQERGTIDMLVEQGLAFPVRQLPDIVDIVEQFQPKPDRANSPLPHAYNFHLTDGGIFNIAQTILECCSPPVLLTPPPVSEKTACDSLPRSTANRGAGET